MLYKMIDIFFVCQVYVALVNNFILWLIFGLSLLFLILPIFTNYVQLHKAIRHWLMDIETRKIVQAWIQLHLRSLYLICILFGSA